MALNFHHELFDPTDHGWGHDDNGSLGIHSTVCKTALQAIFEFVNSG